MKKTLSLILVLTLCLSLCACGILKKDYDSRIIDFFGNDFYWDMTIDDAVDFIESNQLRYGKIEINEYTSYTIVTDDFFIFRFDPHGKMEFLKIRFTADYFESKETIFDLMIDTFGDYDDEKEIASAPYYYWYGTMSGKHTRMLFHYDSIGDACYIEFYPEK